MHADWLEKFREFGHATESSIRVLADDGPRTHSFQQYGSASIFFIGLEGGSDQANAHFSVYVGNTTGVIVPPLPNNSTLLVCQSFGTPFANLSLPGNGNTALELFAASNATVFMSGGFWTLSNSNMMETVTKADGTSASHRWVFPRKMTGATTHSVTLRVRERVRYTVGPGPALL